MYILDGKLIDGPFTDRNGNQYPSDWLSFSTQADRDRIGVVEVPDPPQPDPRIYASTRNDDGTWTAVERPLAEIKANAIQRINFECQRRIYSKYSRETQASALMNIYGQAFLDTMRNDIVSMISSSNTACDAVNNATTSQTAINAEVVTWPL